MTFGQLFGDSQTSSTDALSNYFQKRMDQDLNRIGMGGNTQPTSTTVPGPAIPQQQPIQTAPQEIPQQTAPQAPTPITPVPAANQILNQPPGQPVVPPQGQQQVPAPGQAQLQPGAPVAPVAPPPAGQAQLAQPAPGQLQQPQAPVQPMIAGNPSTDVGQTPTEQAVNQIQQQPPTNIHAQNLVNWQDDPRKLQLIANDKRTEAEGGPSDGIKIVANKNLAEHYIDTSKKNEETKRAQTLIDNNDTVGIANALKRKNDEEGSYLKAYLYRRFGLNDLAKQEQIKLGAGSTTEQVQMPDGSTALIRVRGDGGVSYGHDLTTGRELNAKELESVAGQVSNLKTAQTQATHAYTTEKTRLEKMRDERIANGYTQQDLIKEGLDDASIDARARKSGNDVVVAARSRYAGAPQQVAIPGAVGESQRNLNKEEKIGLEITPNRKVAAADWAHDNGLPVISGHRNAEKQAGLIDHYDEKGVARTAEGRPVAIPGTSKHETYDAFDVDQSKMTPELERKATEAGFKNDIKGDPNHWYRETTPAGDITTKAKTPTSILDNWERKRPDESFDAFKNRKKLSAQEIRDAGEALADGTLSPKDLSARAGSNLREYAMLYAKEVNPKFNGANAEVMKKTKMDFTSGRTSNQVLAHTTALGQVGMVEEAFNAQQNGDVQKLNAIKRRYEIETGNSLPIGANTTVAIFGPEVIKSIVPGGGALHDRLEAKHLLDPNMSSAQFNEAMRVIKEFQGESLLALRNKWTSSGLPKEQFRDQILSDSPDAQDALDRAEGHRTQRREAATNPQPTTVNHQSGAQAELDRRRKARGY